MRLEEKTGCLFGYTYVEYFPDLDYFWPCLMMQNYRAFSCRILGDLGLSRGCQLQKWVAVPGDVPVFLKGAQSPPRLIATARVLLCRWGRAQTAVSGQSALLGAQV